MSSQRKSHSESQPGREAGDSDLEIKLTTPARHTVTEATITVTDHRSRWRSEAQAASAPARVAEFHSESSCRCLGGRGRQRDLWASIPIRTLAMPKRRESGSDSEPPRRSIKTNRAVPRVVIGQIYFQKSAARLVRES